MATNKEKIEEVERRLDGESLGFNFYDLNAPVSKLYPVAGSAKWSSGRPFKSDILAGSSPVPATKFYEK